MNTLAVLAECASMRLGVYAMLARGVMAGEDVVASVGIARAHAVSALAEVFMHVEEHGASDAFRAVTAAVERRVPAFSAGCLDVVHVETMGETLRYAAAELERSEIGKVAACVG